MPNTPEPPSATVPSNIQDAFLNRVRRERLPVAIHMMDGTDVEGRIKHFDRFAVVVEQNGADQMIFKHAIAAIRMPPTAGGDVPPD
jgi:host factor-I protein